MKLSKDYKALLSNSPREFGTSLSEYNFEKRLLQLRGKVYILKDKDICLTLIKLHYDTKLAEHPGH